MSSPHGPWKEPNGWPTVQGALFCISAGKDQQVNGDKDETEADKVADKLESLSVKDSEKAAESKSEETSKNDEKKEDA